MLKPATIVASILCLTGAVLLACEEESKTNPFHPPRVDIEGFACEDLITAYTTWAFFRDPETPIACGEGPSPGIWFISSGGANENGEVFCTLPSDASLAYLVPQNFWVNCPEVFGDGDCFTDATAIEWVEQGMEANWAEGVTLDGVAPDGELGDYACRGDMADLIYDPDQPSRVTIDGTDCSAPYEEGNPCGFPAGPRRAIMGGGFFVLRPLGVGQHTLLAKKCIADSGCYDFTFVLSVVPREQL